MRIISKFHDYYDAVMKSGQDRSLIYIRKKEEIPLQHLRDKRELPDFPKFNHYYYVPGRTGFTADYSIIGFCGKIYPVVRANFYDFGKGEVSQFCFKIEDIDDFVTKNYKKKYHDAYFGRGNPREWSFSHRRSNFVEFFDACQKKQNQYQEFFIKHKTPIFIVNDKNLILNGCLKDYEFYRIFNPYTTFQELQMYWCNQANPEKPIPHVSDKDLLICKGFDPKWSFRQPPKDK